MAYAAIFLSLQRMQKATLPAAAVRPKSPARLPLVFVILFIAYQLPEGLGMRVLHSIPVQAVLMIAFLPVAWLCGRALGFAGLDAWYLHRGRHWALLLGACFALSVLAKLGALAIGSAAGVYRVSGAGLDAAACLLAAVTMVPETFFPSVAEDIVTRGFVMRAFPTLSRRWLFIPFSALVFVLNHIYRLANGPAEWAMLFAFGLAYAAALYRTRNLWAAVGLHWGWNYAGKLADQVASVNTLVPNAWMMSAATHLVLLAVVLIAFRARARR
jgi:membrane protease YdiL (CAAX protease family)